MLVGDTAGFLNMPKIKGTHTAMKSGMIAAEAVFEHLRTGGGAEVVAYPERLRHSWVWDELYRVRNIRPSFRWGLYGGIAYSALDTYVLRGKAPWTLHNHADHTAAQDGSRCTPIAYPKPDGTLTFDRLSSVFVSNTNHEEDQLPHLQLKDRSVPINVNLALYDAPEQRYCPAGVYEIVRDADGRIRACRSTRRTACTARPATSRIRPRTSTGWCPKAAAARTIRTCSVVSREAFTRITSATHAAMRPLPGSDCTGAARLRSC